MISIGALLLPFMLAGPPAEAAKMPKPDFDMKLEQYDIQLTSYTFPSGLVVIFQEEHSQPIISVTTVFDSGAEHDQPGMEGIAHVVEHLAFRAQHGDLPKNMDLVKQLGGSFNASTWLDWTNYMTIAPRDAMSALLAIEARRMKDGVANVTEEDVKLEVEIARNEKRMRDENGALGDAFRVIGTLMFPEGHPYTRSVIGSHESLSNINLAAVQEYVAKNYVPEKTTIVVVGDFEMKNAINILMQSFEQDLDLLMDHSDARKYQALTTQKEKNDFVDAWFPRLTEYIQQNANGKGATKRVDCDKRQDPPMPASQEPLRLKGQIAEETTVIAWSVPGGYCGEDTIANIAANQLTNYIYQTIVPSWEWSNDEQSIEGLGCFYNASEYAGYVACYIEPSSDYSNLTGERLAEKAADALYMQWDREVYKNEYVRSFVDWSFQTSKNGGMAQVLGTVDEVASLYGRATATAMDAHFTGDVRYFSRTMNQVDSVTGMFPVQEFARKWLTRDRMVTVIVEPMDEEERARKEAAARGGEEGVQDYHATSRDDKMKTLFTMEDMSGEKLASQVVTPDRSKARELTLDNGMKVVIYPHGEAPLVRAELIIGGNADSSTEEGLDYFAESMHRRGMKIPSEENMLKVAGYYSEGTTGNSRILSSGGTSGNLTAFLSRLRHEVGEVDWVMANKREWLKKRISGAKGWPYSNDKGAAGWSSRQMSERLWGDHPYGNWGDVAYYERMRDWDKSTVEQWVYRKYQPANATLIVVGKISDIDQAEADIRSYFESWAPEPGVEVGPISSPEVPTHKSERKVLIYAKPTATQSEVTLGCAVEPWTQETKLVGKIMGDSISELSWRRLREKAGVTYGAYAYNSSRPGGANALMISGLFQNDATEFAISTYLDLIDKAVAGDIDPSVVATAKWARARESVLGQQSSNQMINYLVATMESGGGFDYLEKMPQILADISIDDVSKMVAPCKGHETITVIGPVEYAEPAVKKLGLAYEIVDWDVLYQAQLNEKDLAKHLKKKEKALAKKAKEEAEKEAGGE